MGSRAIVVVGRDAATIERRVGITGQGVGACYTRTGRRFFEDRTIEAQLLLRVCDALTATGLWAELGTNWVVLDSELMPWSFKAQELLREQYAAVGVAASTSLKVARQLLGQTEARGIDANDALPEIDARQHLAQLHSESYAQYCWPVASIDDIRLAPFHLMASEGQVHTDKNHLWHMNVSARLCQADPVLFQATQHKMVRLDSPDEIEATGWWEELTGMGQEGMVVKPMEFIATGRRGLVQPAMKCRGGEYLRIIYGPEYSLPENIERLRNRRLSRKWSLALREFALGIEGLQRFNRGRALLSYK